MPRIRWLDVEVDGFGVRSCQQPRNRVVLRLTVDLCDVLKPRRNGPVLHLVVKRWRHTFHDGVLVHWLEEAPHVLFTAVLVDCAIEALADGLESVDRLTKHLVDDHLALAYEPKTFVSNLMQLHHRKV